MTIELREKIRKGDQTLLSSNIKRKMKLHLLHFFHFSRFSSHKLTLFYQLLKTVNEVNSRCTKNQEQKFGEHSKTFKCWAKNQKPSYHEYLMFLTFANKIADN